MVSETHCLKYLLDLISSQPLLKISGWAQNIQPKSMAWAKVLGLENPKPEPGAKRSQACGLALAWPILSGLAWPLTFRSSQHITNSKAFKISHKIPLFSFALTLVAYVPFVSLIHPFYVCQDTISLLFRLGDIMRNLTSYINTVHSLSLSSVVNSDTEVQPFISTPYTILTIYLVVIFHL